MREMNESPTEKEDDDNGFETEHVVFSVDHVAIPGVNYTPVRNGDPDPSDPDRVRRRRLRFGQERRRRIDSGSSPEARSRSGDVSLSLLDEVGGDEIPAPGFEPGDFRGRLRLASWKLLCRLGLFKESDGPGMKKSGEKLFITLANDDSLGPKPISTN